MLSQGNNQLNEAANESDSSDSDRDDYLDVLPQPAWSHGNQIQHTKPFSEASSATVQSIVSGAAGPSSARQQHHPPTFNGLPKITNTTSMAGASKAAVATAAAERRRGSNSGRPKWPKTGLHGSVRRRGGDTLRRRRPDKKSVVKRPRQSALRKRRDGSFNYERKGIGGVVR